MRSFYMMEMFCASIQDTYFLTATNSLVCNALSQSVIVHVDNRIYLDTNLDANQPYRMHYTLAMRVDSLLCAFYAIIK